MGSDELPFLLVHGTLVWGVALAGFVVLVVGVVLAGRVVIARRRLSVAMRPVRVHRGILRGVLRGGSAITTTFEVTPDHTSIVNGRDDDLWLETPDRRIALIGPLTVIGGSRCAARNWKLPALAADRIASRPEAFRRATAVMVSSGDHVLVRGDARPSPGSREVGHREADIEWSIGGDSSTALIEIAAVAPRAPRAPLGTVRLALLIGASIMVGRWIESTIVSSYRSQCLATRPAASSDTPFELAGHACIVAASYDGSGLDNLLQLLREHPSRDPVTLRAYDAIGRLATDCKTRLYWMTNDQRFEALVDEARLCGDPRAESAGLVALGRFDEAATIHVSPQGVAPELPSIDTLIAAGRWSEGAERVTSIAASTSDEPTALYQRCVAQVLAFRGGNRSALDTLRRLVHGQDGAMCDVMLADIDPAARAHWLATEKPASFAERQLRFAAGADDEPKEFGGPPSRLLVSPDRAFNGALLWLPFEPGGSPRHRSAALRWRAAALVFHGNTDEALRVARESLALPDDEVDDADRRDLSALISAIKLYTPETELTQIPELDFGGLWGRLRIRGGHGADGDFAPHEDFRRAAYAARDGYGEPILWFLRGHNPWFDDIDLLALLPRLRSHRAEIATALAWVPAHSYDHLSWPVQLALGAFARREVLAAAGARDAAARWDAIFKRFDAVLRDRDRLVALMLWEM